MENTIVKHKWFWAWQDDKEEEWLSDMSKQGYHLSKPGFFGRYEFEQREPRNYVYRMDFMTGKKDQKDTYLQYCSLMRAGSTLASLAAGSTSEFWLRKMRSLKSTQIRSVKFKNTVEFCCYWSYYFQSICCH